MEDQFQVTADRPGFAPIPLRLLEDERITEPTTVAVYAALAAFIDYGTGKCWPSHATIAARARVEVSTVQRHIKVLRDLGYLTVASGKAAGTPNRYHLTDAWGRSPARGGSVTGDLGGAAPVTDERDLVNEKREGGANYAMAPVGASQPQPAPATLDPPLLLEIKKISGERGIGTAWINPGWAKRFEHLLNEVREADVLPSFRTCLDNGGNPAYFCADFAKWLGKWTSTSAVTARPQHEKAPAARCPICGEPMGTAEGDWLCIPCHARFDRDMRPVKLAIGSDFEKVREKFGALR